MRRCRVRTEAMRFSSSASRACAAVDPAGEVPVTSTVSRALTAARLPLTRFCPTGARQGPSSAVLFCLYNEIPTVAPTSQCKWDLKTSLHHVDTKRFVQPNSGATPLTMAHTPLTTAHTPHHGTHTHAPSTWHTPFPGFINFLIGLERRLFGTTSCSAADFGYAADSGDLCGLPAMPPTPMRR